MRWWDGTSWTEIRRSSVHDEEEPIETSTEQAIKRELAPWKPQEPAQARPLGFGAKALLWIVGLLLIGGIASIAGLGGSSSSVTVIDHSCIPNPDGSVHVQGELRNDGSRSEIASIEYTLTLYGGETKTSKPFGGYDVPVGETLVGEDLNVPPNAEWVECSVEVVG